MTSQYHCKQVTNMYYIETDTVYGAENFARKVLAGMRNEASFDELGSGDYCTVGYTSSTSRLWLLSPVTKYVQFTIS